MHSKEGEVVFNIFVKDSSVRSIKYKESSYIWGVCGSRKVFQ